jgi:dolichol-phosphate mannosyltransferase
MAVSATKHPMTLVVVIPTYNERENIVQQVTGVLALDPAPQVLIVDDASPDGTGEIADALAVQYPGRVHVLHRAGKEGLGRAYVAGFRRAIELGTTHIAQMDADLSHAPADLQSMICEARATGADLVLGSRYIPGGKTVGWPWPRKAISRLGGLYAGLIVGVPIRDFTGGFKLWRRETLEAIDLETVRSDGYGFQIETTYRALRLGKTWRQVPITFHDRIAGASKLSRSVVIEAAAMVWRVRFRQLAGKRW